MSVSDSMTTFTESLFGKVVVADTSSLLVSGTQLLSALPECSLVIPIVVVKELEDKRTHSTVGFLAREWLRLIESLRVSHGEDLKTCGVPLAEYPGVTLRVEPNNSNQSILPKHLQDGSHDSTILAVAFRLSTDAESSEKRSVVVLSNDTPMRLHSMNLALDAFEFNSTFLDNATPFDGLVTVQLTEDEYLGCDMLVQYGEPLEKILSRRLEGCDQSHSLVRVLPPGDTKPLRTYLYSNGFLSEVSRRTSVSGVTPRTEEQAAALQYLRLGPDELPIVSIGGGAGTGKTLLSIAVGLEELKQGTYQRLIVFRSLHEMGQGQEMGFLPGDVDEKMEAWAGAVYDALDVIAAASRKKGSKPESLKAEVKKLREMVEVSPITYLRGRSLANSYIILDESQNFSRSELLNILSRVGEGSKIVMIGDPDQVDNRYLQSGPKSDVWSVIHSLKSSELFAHLTLQKTERSKVAELSAKILSRG